MAKKTKKKTSARRAATKSVKKPAARRAAAKRTAAGKKHVLVSVAPGFTVSDIDKSIAWYRDVLGFAVTDRWENEGKLLGAEMRAGGVAFYLGQDDWKLGRDRVKGQGTRMYVTTGPEIDRLAKDIKTRGGALTDEPKDEHGMRTFSISDPDGFKMTFMFVLKK